MNKKNIISLLVLAILAVAIPLGLNLAREQQTLKSSATEAPITFSGDNAEQRNRVWVVKDRTKPITVTFTSPLGPPGVGIGSTGPTILQSVSNPSKKKVSFSFPSLVKEVYAFDCSAGGGLVKKGDCDRRSMEATWNIPNVYGSCNIFIQGGDNYKTVSHECSGSGVPINTFPNNSSAPLRPDGVYALFVSNGKGDPDNCDGSDRDGNVEIGRVTFTCPVPGGWSGWTPACPSCSNSTVTQTRTCTNPVPKNGGTCSGSDSQVCNIPACGGGTKYSCSNNQCVSSTTGYDSIDACRNSGCGSTSSGSSNTYVDPGSGNAGQSFQVTATATSSCASGIGTNFGNGLTNCRGGCGDGGTTDGCKCDSNPKSDGKSCWWRWTCTGSTAGSYTARFNASGSSCSSSTGYTINASTVTATVDIKANGSDSITIDHNASVNLAWTSSSNITSCTASGTASGSWSGSKPANGNESTGPLSGPSTKTYTLNCTGSGVTASDSVVVTVNAPPTQSCSITGDFNGDTRIDLTDYEIWKNAFVNGNPIPEPRSAPAWDCRGVTVDLVLFNTWRTQYSR